MANHGHQALTVLADEPNIDLLFRDVIMPGGMNGYQLAAQATALYPDLKVLMVSGYEQNARKQEEYSQFSADRLTKPYRVADLAERLRTIVDDAPVSHQ